MFACSLASLFRNVWLRSEEHTSELQSQSNLVCRLLLEKKFSYLINSNGLWFSATSKCHRRRSCDHPNPLEVINHLLNRIITFLFFNDTASTEIYPLSLHDALPISL